MLYSVQKTKKKKKKMGSFVHDYTLLLLVSVVSASVMSISPCMATDSDIYEQISDDILGLIVFKSDITDPFSHLSSWNEDDASPCSWRFVQCNNTTSRVTGIFLDDLNLSGKIGFGIEKLKHLKVLSLSNNNFRVSPSLVLPGSLHRLNLSSNGLSGHLPPSLLNMSSIFSLDLSHNSLSGQIAEDFFSGCSSGLRFLSLSGNMFDGPVPTTLSSCSLLNTLNLSNNQFSGNPSSGLWKLQRLRVLDLSGNRLSGPLPGGILSLHFLKHLLLRSNQFSGPIPTDLGLCPHLSILDLSNNQFTGTLPESLKKLSSLSVFSLSNNFLSGDIPEWIGNMNSLKMVELSDNGLSGSIPASFAYCSSLSVVKLRRNNFSGDIPTDLFNLGLEEVDFSHNGFTGMIPTGSSSLFRSLRVLDLSDNNLTGIIPPEIDLFSNLHYLNLSWNNLQSKMPPEIGYLKNLSVVDLRSSGIYGSIPLDICHSSSLRILQLDLNLLTGIIPQEIGNCSSLYLLSLSHNKLTGQIPGSISMLDELKILKLEYNELIGEIPPSLGRLQNLLVVNISYNRLIGRLPDGGIFPSLDRTALEGNLGICSPLLTDPCQMDVPKPLVLDPNSIPNQGSNSLLNPRQHMFLSVSAIVAISAAVLIACGVILVTVLNASARRRIPFVDAALESIRSMTSSKSAGNNLLPLGKLIWFDTKTSSIPFFDNPNSLLNNALEIGEGAFGTVYKVLLAEQGRDDVVVKRLFTSTLTQYHEDFDREVRVLGKARHPNLVSLQGYYWTPELQLLVTEFAPNGSLHSKLHERLPSSSPPLSWEMRLNIVMGTAKGLAHLHHSFCPPIIHYNIKPSNILLDQNYNAKISDFGLARLLAKQFQSTPGYVAPEVACQSLRVNEKCDVYSFGMLILEIVTGRMAVEYGEESVLILNDDVRFLLEEGNVLECVDPIMVEYLEDEVLPLLKLALVCTSQVPSSRPSMAEVLQILQVIKTPVPQRIQVV